MTRYRIGSSGRVQETKEVVAKGNEPEVQEAKTDHTTSISGTQQKQEEEESFGDFGAKFLKTPTSLKLLIPFDVVPELHKSLLKKKRAKQLKKKRKTVPTYEEETRRREERASWPSYDEALVVARKAILNQLRPLCTQEIVDVALQNGWVSRLNKDITLAFHSHLERCVQREDDEFVKVGGHLIDLNPTVLDPNNLLFHTEALKIFWGVTQHPRVKAIRNPYLKYLSPVVAVSSEPNQDAQVVEKMEEHQMKSELTAMEGRMEESNRSKAKEERAEVESMDVEQTGTEVTEDAEPMEVERTEEDTTERERTEVKKEERKRPEAEETEVEAMEVDRTEQEMAEEEERMDVKRMEMERSTTEKLEEQKEEAERTEEDGLVSGEIQDRSTEMEKTKGESAEVETMEVDVTEPEEKRETEVEAEPMEVDGTEEKTAELLGTEAERKITEAETMKIEGPETEKAVEKDIKKENTEENTTKAEIMESETSESGRTSRTGSSCCSSAPYLINPSRFRAIDGAMKTVCIRKKCPIFARKNSKYCSVECGVRVAHRMLTERIGREIRPKNLRQPKYYTAAKISELAKEAEQKRSNINPSITDASSSSTTTTASPDFPPRKVSSLPMLFYEPTSFGSLKFMSDQLNRRRRHFSKCHHVCPNPTCPEHQLMNDSNDKKKDVIVTQSDGDGTEEEQTEEDEESCEDIDEEIEEAQEELSQLEEQEDALQLALFQVETISESTIEDLKANPPKAVKPSSFPDISIDCVSCGKEFPSSGLEGHMEDCYQRLQATCKYLQRKQTDYNIWREERPVICGCPLSEGESDQSSYPRTRRRGRKRKRQPNICSNDSQTCPLHCGWAEKRRDQIRLKREQLIKRLKRLKVKRHDEQQQEQ